MLLCKYSTKRYKHDDFFHFKGNAYRVHSIVRLTKEGQRYLGSKTRDVILTEQFTNWNGKLCWKYEFKSSDFYTTWPVDYSTDKIPDKLIEEVVIPATEEYASREVLGAYSPFYKTGKKCVPKDWEMPQLIQGWLVFILVFVGASIFQGGLDWIIRIAACVIFAFYRNSLVEANTTYEHEEDDKIIRKKLEILYGMKCNKEDSSNE